MNKVFTIGYSCFQINEFIKVLKKYKINSLIDVRSNPNSKFFVDYNEKNLQILLKNNGIIYRNYKKEFGARQVDKNYYTEGYLDFEKFAKSLEFLEGVSKIEKGMEMGYTFAFMCAEKNPSDCHRSIMVARQFSKIGYDVENILSNCELESQNSIEEKLVKHYFPNRNQISFFQEELLLDELINKAYRHRNREIGYREDRGDNIDE